MNKTILLILSVLILFVFGCQAKSGGQYSFAGEASPESASADYAGIERSTKGFNSSSKIAAEKQNVPAQTPGKGENLSAVESQTRKLIKNASLRVRIEDLETGDKAVTGKITEYNGYASETQIYENSRHYTLRVPSKFYETLLSEAGSLGKVLSRTESARDVTLEFYDLDGRLTTKKELLKTFQSYLGKAKNIEEIMTVESKIADLQNEIDWLGTDLSRLANLVDYATIELELLGPASAYIYHKPTISERITDLLGSFGDVASTFVVVLFGVIVFGIPLIILLVLFYWLLFGKIGLLKKLFAFAGGRKNHK